MTSSQLFYFHEFLTDAAIGVLGGLLLLCATKLLGSKGG